MPIADTNDNFVERCFGFRKEPGIVSVSVADANAVQYEHAVMITYIIIMLLACLGCYLYKRKM